MERWQGSHTMLSTTSYARLMVPAFRMQAGSDIGSWGRQFYEELCIC